MMPVYCINLERAKERRTNIEKEWTQLRGVDVQFFDAVDHKNLDITNLPYGYNTRYDNREEFSQLNEKIPNAVIKSPLSIQQIACLISHTEVLKLAINADLSEAIVIEDDAIPLFKTNQEFYNRLNQINEDQIQADIVLLHDRLNVNIERYKLTPADILKQNYHHLLKSPITCTQGIYYRSKAAMLAAIEAFSKLIYPADWSLGICIQNGVRLGILKLPITKHSEAFTSYISDSGKKHMYIETDIVDSLLNGFAKYQKGVWCPFYNVDNTTIEYHFLEFYKKNIDRFKKLQQAFLPVNWTALYCDPRSSELCKQLQEQIDDIVNINKDIKIQYFTVVQHADGVRQKLPPDTIVFSGGNYNPDTIPIPLICKNKITDYHDNFKTLLQNKTKDIFCSFIGSTTHEIRKDIYSRYKDTPGYYFYVKEWSPHNTIEEQKRFIDITHRSKFTLCPRGYGVTSFRLYEAMQLGSVPVYVYDTPHLPYAEVIDWNKICVLVHVSEIDRLDEILKSISDEDYKEMLSAIEVIYSNFFNLESSFEYILQYLEKEPSQALFNSSNSIIQRSQLDLCADTSLTVITALHHNDNNIKITAKSVLPHLGKNFKWIIKYSKEQLSDELIELAKIEHVTVIGQEDRSLYDGLNQALDVTTTKYFIVLGAGDTIYSNIQAELKSILSKNPASNSFYFAVNAPRYGYIIYPDGFDEKASRNPCCHQGVIMETQKAIELKGFDVRYEIAADMDLIYRYIEKYTSFTTSNIIISVFSGGGVSHNRLFESCIEGMLVRHRHYSNLWRSGVEEINNNTKRLENLRDKIKERIIKQPTINIPLDTIYTVTSKSHDIFLPWFETIKDIYPNIDIKIARIDQLCESGIFKTSGWREATAAKLEAIIGFLKPIDGSVLVYSDIDVQFFRSFHNTINNLLTINDIVFQNDYRGAQCTGFFACRRTPQILKLFNDAHKLLTDDNNKITIYDDQVAIQAALARDPKIVHDFLPVEFFTYGYYNSHWDGSKEFLIPTATVMHHANWTTGIDNKIRLLQYVRDKYNNYKKSI